MRRPTIPAGWMDRVGSSQRLDAGRCPDAALGLALDIRCEQWRFFLVVLIRLLLGDFRYLLQRDTVGLQQRKKAIGRCHLEMVGEFARCRIDRFGAYLPGDVPLGSSERRESVG